MTHNTRVASRRHGRLLVTAMVLAGVLAACTGRGGGYVPPSVGFTGPGVFGFTFSCERSSNSTSTNPPTGRLRLEVSYSDKGMSLIGTPFAIHGVADTIDPVLESAICIGQEPPPGGNELIFLGKYRLTSGAPAGFPRSCPSRESATTPLCRFEIVVRDNDLNRAPSRGDLFAIKLSSSTVLDDDLPAGSVFYARTGILEGGNLIVDS